MTPSRLDAVAALEGVSVGTVRRWAVEGGDELDAHGGASAGCRKCPISGRSEVALPGVRGVSIGQGLMVGLREGSGRGLRVQKEGTTMAKNKWFEGTATRDEMARLMPGLHWRRPRKWNSWDEPLAAGTRAPGGKLAVMLVTRGYACLWATFWPIRGNGEEQITVRALTPRGLVSGIRRDIRDQRRRLDQYDRALDALTEVASEGCREGGEEV